MRKHYKITVIGRVQGVFYRGSTMEKARELGLAGTVRNMPDGSVYIEAEGEEANLKKLTSWCKIGPTRAKVEEVIVKEGEIKNFQGFMVIR